MHEFDLILTLTAGLSFSLLFGYASQRVGLSPIVGYLLAGVAVGPFTPGYVAHGGLANQMAEIGIVLLMFGVGLKFHLAELLAVRKVSLPGAFIGIGVAIALGTGVGRFMGWPTATAVIFGLTISVASTVVLLRVLSDHDELHTPSGHIAIGWLVVEDLFTVIALVIMPVASGQGDLLVPTLTALGKFVFFVGIMLTLGKRVVPVLLGHVAKTGSRELFTLTALVIALGTALLSAKVFHISMALGAFLGGMVVGQSHFSARAASEALPLRDAFAVLFFVSIGMQLNPTTMLANAGLVVATLSIVLIGKPLAAFLLVRALRYPPSIAARVASSLAQIGEFSFVVAGVAFQMKMLPERAIDALVVVAIISITLSPITFRASRRLGSWLERQENAKTPALPTTADIFHAIVVGYGPTGRTVTRLLRENRLEPTVIELNHETVARLQSEGIRAVYGDAAHREILLQAGIETAKSLIFAASGSPVDVVIAAARELNPDLHIVARAAYLRDVAAIREAGADVVVVSESEVALAMSEQILNSLGATREQLDRERDRVRDELLA